jgi:hypothetical protein
LSEHYKIHKPEPLELIQRYNLNFVEGNVVKYVMRSPFKGDSTGDLKKALSYAHLLQDIGFYRQFDASELDEYTELNEIEKEIVYDVIRNDLHTIIRQLSKAIQEREKQKEGKPFDPDWLPPHPLVTLLDVVDQDPCKFMEMLDSKLDKEWDKDGDPDIRVGCISLLEVLVPEPYFMKALSELGCGSEEFWKNRYKDYWEKRKQSVTFYNRLKKNLFHLK